ncbi:protein translocase subunit SecF [Candidatus Saganbacteria bacterium]|nr:protein translocase subunit SecF [Candidatus Saganbacteria bacterium]
MIFDFIGNRRYWFAISGLLLLVALFAFSYNLIVRGSAFNFGTDFTGGTMINLRFNEPVSVHDVRLELDKYNLGQSIIQKSGETDISIRAQQVLPDLRTKLIEDLKAKYGEVELLEVDTVGPMLGKELQMQTLLALILASIGIIIYISFRFEFKYAVAALLALYHDALITAGVTALLWRNVEAPFVAALLTIMGYSINDTIVIFDRIRENIKVWAGKKKSFIEIVNLSISETMARSINTVLTVVITVLCLLFFGGETIRDFALVLLFGFVIGAYSSIFVASPILVAWTLRDHKFSTAGKRR